MGHQFRHKDNKPTNIQTWNIIFDGVSYAAMKRHTRTYAQCFVNTSSDFRLFHAYLIISFLQDTSWLPKYST
jgi:hypothetical protein